VFLKAREEEEKFVDDLSTPLNKIPEEILMHLQNYMIEPSDGGEYPFSFQQSVLPVNLYLQIEKNKGEIILEEISEYKEKKYLISEPDSRNILAEWENIHNKVLFDAINEALDNFRPYGLKGPPLPWS
jgi:hypothetical protein